MTKKEGDKPCDCDACQAQELMNQVSKLCSGKKIAVVCLANQGLMQQLLDKHFDEMTAAMKEIHGDEVDIVSYQGGYH